MRPDYETRQDFDRESRVADWFVQKMIHDGWFRDTAVAKPLKKHYCLDRAIVDGDEILAFCEVKVRTNRQFNYSTYLISLEKMRNMRLMARDTGVPSYLVIRWTDAIGYFEVNEQTDFTDFSLRLGGRTDRGDGADVEPVLHIPVGKFISYRKN